jgi:hypothetical protein
MKNSIHVCLVSIKSSITGKEIFVPLNVFKNILIKLKILAKHLTNNCGYDIIKIE